MKKYLSTLAVAALATSAFAQGTVNFANNAATVVKYGDTGSTYAAPINGGSAPAGGLSSIQVIWAESGTSASTYKGESLANYLSANPGWSAVAASVKTLNPAGRFSAGAQTLTTATAGSIASVQIIGWYNTLASYTSFDAAYNASSGKTYVGMSGVFSIDTANPLATPTPETPTFLTATPYAGLLLTPVPEPSTFALAGLGAAAMLIFRRRN